MTYAVLLAVLILGIGTMVAMTLVGRKDHRRAVQASREAAPILAAQTSAVQERTRQTVQQIAEVRPQPLEA